MILNFTTREKCLFVCQQIESESGWNVKPMLYLGVWVVSFLEKPVQNGEYISKDVKPLT